MAAIHNMFHSAQKRFVKSYKTATDQKSDARQEMEARFPKFGEQLVNRTKFAQNVLINQYRITPKSLMFDAIVKFDRIWFKYATGYYNFALEKTFEGIANGRSIIPTTYEALADLRYAADDLKNIIWAQPYAKLADATYQAARVLSNTATDILEEGPLRFARRVYTRHIDYRRQVVFCLFFFVALKQKKGLWFCVGRKG